MDHPRRSIHLALLFSVICTVASGIFLDKASYEDLSEKLGTLPTLLIITVRWCDHCIALKSEIRVLAHASKHSEEVLVAQADADDEPAVSSKLGVSGFPSILYVPAGQKMAEGRGQIVEFADYRWAEIMAEFVNNKTRREVLKVKPCQAFLKWRQKHPYNLGKQGFRPEEKDSSTKNSEKRHILPEITSVREPIHFHQGDFLQTVFSQPGTRFMILLYKTDDPLLRDIFLQWRQATSAFTGADNITIGVVNLSDTRNDKLGETLRIEDTPRCFYYPRCENSHSLPACKEPLTCDDDLDDTENIIQFLSDRVLEEMGVRMRKTNQDGKTGTYHLTVEEYQKLKSDGKIFANDPDHVDAIREMYKSAAKPETWSDKDEL